MDKIKAVYISIALATLAMSILWWWLLVLSAIIMLAYGMLPGSRPKNRDHELLAFTKEFSESVRKEGLNPALSRTLSAQSAPKEIKELSKSIMLGKVDFSDSLPCEDKNTKELMEIIEISVQNGADIRNNLNMFISRMESDMENTNQSMQSSLNMNSLSSLGISFFVPLFGGIGSSIISSSGSILGAGQSAETTAFQVVIVAYIAIMSYIMEAFKSGGSRSPLFKSFQAAIISAGIIKASAAFMAYAI